jgi:hypothetical protein
MSVLCVSGHISRVCYNFPLPLPFVQEPCVKFVFTQEFPTAGTVTHDNILIILLTLCLKLQWFHDYRVGLEFYLAQFFIKPKSVKNF